MVYNNGLIVAIKNKGKVLREFKGNIIKIPFGADYSIFIKNKDKNRKALVNIKVDGKDVLDGNSIIIDADSSTELKGFMKGTTVKNKFRFIEKTKQISEFRGNYVEDGLVEVDYRFEEYKPYYYEDLYSKINSLYIEGDRGFYGASFDGNIKVKSFAYDSVNESGITVPGKVTKQDFTIGSIGDLENISYNIILHLKGNTDRGNKKVKKPITVKSKVQCKTCGKKWNSRMTYCGTCSTYLH